MILVRNPKDEVILRLVVFPYLGINQTVNRTIINIHLKRRKLDLSRDCTGNHDSAYCYKHQ